MEYAAQLDPNEDVPSLSKDIRKYKAATIVPMSAATSLDPSQTWANIDVADSIPMWGFGDPKDDLYGGYEQDFSNEINKAKAGYSHFTNFSTGHGPWNPFYTPTYTETFTWNGIRSAYNIYTWMLGISRAPLPMNPVANAGTAQTITLPVNQVTLNGSASSGTITSYTWTQVSGPSTATIATPTGVSTAVSGLVQGVYVFQLAVTGGSTATVQVTVKPAPVADAGPAQTILLPASQAKLNGNASTGTITSYGWTQVSGPSTATIANPSGDSTIVSGLVQGVYVFQLTVTGGSTATVQISVVEPPLAANAGAAQTIYLPAATAVLNGSGSTGYITSYSWMQLSGPAGATIVSPDSVTTSVTGLVQGSYVFGLVVNEDSASTVQVTVTAPPLVANAGVSQTVTLPASQTLLSGAASGGLITSYSWAQVSGPAGDTLVTPLGDSTLVSGLVQGVYVFQLTVTDINDSIRTDTMTVTVRNATVAKQINVQVYGGTSPYSNTAWNNWNVNANYVSSGFNYSDGTASGVTGTLSINESVVDNGATYGGTNSMAPAGVLRFSSYCETTRTLTLSNLKAAATYNIELYASRGSNSGQKSVFSVGAIKDTILSYNNLTNKAVFTGVAPSSGKIVISISTPTGYNYLNGFAITEITAAGTGMATSAVSAVGAEFTGADAATGDGLGLTPAFALYPNPAKDQLTLTLNNAHTGAMRVMVVNAAGAPVLNILGYKDQPVSTTVLPVSLLAPGAYFITVQIGNWRVTKGWVKL